MAQEESRKSIPWYDLPFYRAMSEQVLTFGVPRGVILANVMLAIIFIFDFHFFYIIPICIALHILCTYVCKSDQQFFSCLRNYISKRNYYST